MHMLNIYWFIASRTSHPHCTHTHTSIPLLTHNELGAQISIALLGPDNMICIKHSCHIYRAARKRRPARNEDFDAHSEHRCDTKSISRDAPLQHYIGNDRASGFCRTNCAMLNDDTARNEHNTMFAYCNHRAWWSHLSFRWHANRTATDTVVHYWFLSCARFSLPLPNARPIKILSILYRTRWTRCIETRFRVRWRGHSQQREQRRTIYMV